ncbi:glycosyl hydrolase [Bacillus benzoevorans]|uniref:Glycosyl hydrolases family 8 n=1 Tax=Bacillus benzoevorans TaxID=1456 RepID=A0A7X0HQZ5_9BACI|nr:glycosyl hydrolase [Bacillus benzoevorans]MBB6443961.1 hypothetical protein [Bacillus benzoevorans]
MMIMLVGIALLFFLLNKEGQSSIPAATEEFIDEWLRNENGTLATYMEPTETEDEDLVQGREALSESIGLWMDYALLKEDKRLFAEAFQLLEGYFLEDDGFVHWKLTETGESEVSTNALVDDLRLIHALFLASEKWKVNKYEKAAVRISQYITQYNRYQYILTDFYDKEHHYASHRLMLSYIEPDALKALKERGLIGTEMYENMLGILENSPQEGPFFPKFFDIKKEEYSYDRSINMIDQSLAAYYIEKSGYSTDQFLAFIKQELTLHGKVVGQYDKVTKSPIVEYESPALYGWLILYSIEAGEKELALQLYQEMVKFRTPYLKYKGGYSVYHNNTHIFDNLVPLLAERTLCNLKLVKVVNP